MTCNGGNMKKILAIFKYTFVFFYVSGMAAAVLIMAVGAVQCCSHLINGTNPDFLDWLGLAFWAIVAGAIGTVFFITEE